MKIYKIANTEDLDELLSKMRSKFNVTLFVEEFEKVIRINSIVVPQGERGKGIGSYIINSIKEYAKGVGKKVVLHPSPSKGEANRLNEFYKKLNFAPVPDKERYKETSDLFSPSEKQWYWDYK